MGKRGPKPGDGQNTAQVSVKMPDAMKQQLARVVNIRRAAEPSLPLSYGLSEYIREILAEHLAKMNVEARDGIPKAASGGRISSTPRKRSSLSSSAKP